MTEVHTHNLSPEYLGPGTWWVWHTQAVYAKTYEERIEVVHLIENTLNHFFCENCKKHGLKYLKEHPLEDVLNLDLGLFKWTVDFHNSGNKFLGKPILSFDEAKQLYLGEEKTCKRCGGDTTYSSTTQHELDSGTTLVANEQKPVSEDESFKTVNRRITYVDNVFGTPKLGNIKLPHVSTNVDSGITFVRSKKTSHYHSHAHLRKHGENTRSGHSKQNLGNVKITYIKT
jgi:hypothetical protein